MDSEDKHVDIHEEAIVKTKKRGDILYYSINQVAALLDEEDSNIRYYTSIFDNILKIEILDKELRYTNRDIDKLEFLINLKNKGMTIKEVQKYCEELPLDIEDLIEIKENNSISAKEIVGTILDLENKQIENLREHLDVKIDKSNELSFQKIAKLIVEEQDKQFTLFRDDILREIKEYIDYKFDIESKVNKDLYNALSIKIDNLTSEKLSIEDNVKLQFNKFNEICISRDRNLIEEIKRFENVIERAYYVQQEVDAHKEKKSFIGKLFGLI